MTVEIDLADLLEDAGLNVYPGSIPDNANYPCVVYQRISTPQIRTHVKTVKMEYPRFQITCWAKHYEDTITTAQTVKTTLDLNQINFKLATKESELDNKEVETNLYRRILDFYIWI